MVFKTLLILLVITVLMEDTASIRKTEEEKKEEEEMAERVNATLAEEEERERLEEEEKRKKKQGKELEKKQDETPKKPEKEEKVRTQDKDEACPPLNYSCPEEQHCPEERPCQPCLPCPICFNQTCQPCQPCKPCRPCLVSNSTAEDFPTVCQCPEGTGLSLPAAVAVGAVTGILVTGLAATVGLILRYVPPVASGFLFLATIIIVWYLCSQYPETARELGGRAATLLREAAAALSHRVMEALRHHNNQVGFS
jgi:hypothetical protein